MSLHDNLKRARLSKQLNQEQLAARLEVTQACVSQYEKGQRVPSQITLIKAAKTFEISIEELVGGDGNEVGNVWLMRKVKGLSPDSIAHLSKVADFLKWEEDKNGHRDSSQFH